MKQSNLGWIHGLLGVIIFAGSMPATRLAVSGFSPEFLTGARAVIAAIFAILCLYVFKQPIPNIKQIRSLVLIALGVVFGFPFFTALALENITAARALVFVALLPLATAIFAVQRAGEKPSIQFWLSAILGSSFVALFMWFQDQQAFHFRSDLYMLIAVLACGLGYAEGGQLSKQLGGWQVICWALIIALPLMLLLFGVYFPQDWDAIPVTAYAGLFYVSLFSMLIGFVFWYKGLAMGGVARVGQIQLLQPFLGLILCAVFLHEAIDFAMIVVCFAVIICVFYAKKYA
ncbi:DMT family transporter [Acinetobacter kanungonis]|uniref:DMT family transporter n=1 Tax=Acinetobacter kanungonis TaxID=2699469 RepID=UPI00137AF718|nr:DMT family transporter [Acinetobacter kanungonis]NCI79248.1 DMT family transporter [Acinetobacter kanungonis]